MYPSNEKQGSIIVYSLLIMTVMLAIGFSMNTVFLRNLRNVNEARDSVIALYAADVGVELCVYEARVRPGHAGGVAVDRTEVFGDNSVYTVNLEPDPGGQRTDIPHDVPAFTVKQLNDLGEEIGTVTDDCTTLTAVDDSFNFRSRGTYRGSSRALEISQ